MNTISVRDFWEVYGKNHAGPLLSTELPPELAYGAVFDQVFGNLTRHDIRLFSHDEIDVVCADCSHAKAAKGDICEGHIGLLKGLLKAGSKCTSRCRRVVSGDECHLTFT